MESASAASSVIELDISRPRPLWSLEQVGIDAALAEHCGGNVGGMDLAEPDDPAALRAALRAAAPTLTELTDTVRRAFSVDLACAVVVPTMGLARFDDHQRRKGMYAFAALLGDPMANHPSSAVVWDVHNEEGAPASHSTTSRAAGYHTDAGYMDIPPKFFLLYAMKAAACGGGESLIRDGRVVLRQLSETPEGRAAIEILRQPLPRRVPSQFRSVASTSDKGYQYSPILADVPLWRWARKNSRLGLEGNPDYATPQVWEALTTVNAHLQDGEEELRPVVPTDGVIVVDNHIALHGRTSFTDTRRHLLRIRFHSPSA